METMLVRFAHLEIDNNNVNNYTSIVHSAFTPTSKNKVATTQTKSIIPMIGIFQEKDS